MFIMQDFITEVFPTKWSFLSEQMFVFSTSAGQVSFVQTDVKKTGSMVEQTFVDRTNSLRLHTKLRPIESYRAIKQECVLTNDSDRLSPALTQIQPLHLEWQTGETPVYIRTIGGGLNESIYPPNTFRVETVRCDSSGFVWMENGFDGRSSNEKIPLMTVCCGDDAVVAGLEWSGLWWMSAKNSGDHLRISCKIPVNGLVLEPGESLKLPAAHYIFSSGGLDGAVNACRRYLGDCIIPTRNGKKIIPGFDYNHWFGIGPDINEDLLKRQADRAAEIGVEHFIIDAGWYGGCVEGNFETGVGSWELVDSTKFPHGLKPIAAYVHSKGLKLGLWFEVERAYRQSKWAKEHPEWFFDIGGDYLHIDLSNGLAVRACVDVVQDAVDRLGISWLKLDYNIGPRRFWEKADPTGKIQFAYIEGLYTFFDELRRRNPDLVLENCASGGRRIDLGTLHHTHVANLTDQTASAEICRFTSCGANYFLPGNAHVIGLPFGSKEVGYSKHEKKLTNHHVLSRMAGMPTLYGDIVSLSSKDVVTIRNAIDFFNEYQDLLQQDFYSLSPQPQRDNEPEIVQFCAYDGQRSVLLAYPGYESGSNKVKVQLKGLQPDVTYELKWAFSTNGISQRCGRDLQTNGLELQLRPGEAQAVLIQG